MDKPTGPFNHKTSTGWALTRFHEKLECAKCHENTNNFTKLNNDWVSCHKNFVTGKFGHEKTGLKLDEIHQEFDCGDCHFSRHRIGVFSVLPIFEKTSGGIRSESRDRETNERVFKGAGPCG